MIYKLSKTISLLFFSLLLSFLTYKLCYFIAEKYFFDKFFYQKSITHGYWIPSKHPTHDDFGHRAKDIYQLQSGQPDPLKTNNSDIFKIALYGDSYVWGQGIKNEQRFAKLLETKLNKIRPTKIISLAETGDNIFDHYQKYKATPEIFGEIDLNVFGLNFNDLIFNNINDIIYDRYHTQSLLASDLFSSCKGPEIYASNLKDVLESSFEENTKNYCAFLKLIPLLPQNNSLYINLSELTDSGPFQTKFNLILQKHNIKLVSPYPPEFISSIHPNKYNLSKIDNHPSVEANRYYTDVLYQEITTNPKWGFIKNE
ncbi:TPA: hypothetical protein DD455_03480 [Candidatus Shapirobacteria bacterium]|nr:hypothetical protein [Candidatus Shapirobacteria bacterium]